MSILSASSTGDSRLRLEKYLAEIVAGVPKVCNRKLILSSKQYLGLASLPDDAANVWKNAAKHYKTSYLAWTSYAEHLMCVFYLSAFLESKYRLYTLQRKQDHYDKVRGLFRDLYTKNLDWPEAIWEAWISFEHLYGSVEEIESCLDKIEKAAYQVNARRAKVSICYPTASYSQVK